MSGEVYFHYSYITRANKWTKSEAQSKLISHFFKPNSFFDRDTKNEFFIGINPNDGKKYLLISERGFREIRTDLEAHLSTKLSFFPEAQDIVYTDLEAFYIENAVDYDKIEKDIKKFNKEAVTKAKLLNNLKELARARQMYEEKVYYFVAIDVESYEKDHSCLLEVGWSIYDSRKDIFMDRHFCVKEYRHLKNGQYLADMKDRFMFGKTVWASLAEISEEFLRDITPDDESDDKVTVLVGHDVNIDVKYFEGMGKHMKNALENLVKFDTAIMYAAREGKAHDRVSLGNLADALNVENYCLHNAGNDAHFTLLSFIELCKLPVPQIITTKVVASS
ncbi:8041_t:CDS:2 [Ambispora leptoticha]|uniref:8041_t:CDS:1 n=1 Tax=Ambispora leptoticha TaxID=144679 RepID=A0A9N8V9D9_9GLOM|nr:8041_t:CDS:2 [Ambispora leptoticha]